MKPPALFAEAAAAFKQVLAAQMGCRPGDYAAETLTVVQRPPGSRERHLALMTTCGLGSVVSVRDPRLASWAREQQLETHFRVFLPSFLERMAAHARELGHAEAKSHSASQGTVLAEDLPPVALPPGYSFRVLEIEEQAELRAGRKFDNALGEPDEHRRIAATRTAIAVARPGGAVAAVAGAWDQYPGVDEIGVDVLREERGKGLGRAVTIEAVRWIRAEGRWPIYTTGSRTCAR